jgi:hypothetical protein
MHCKSEHSGARLSSQQEPQAPSEDIASKIDAIVSARWGAGVCISFDQSYVDTSAPGSTTLTRIECSGTLRAKGTALCRQDGSVIVALRVLAPTADFEVLQIDEGVGSGACFAQEDSEQQYIRQMDRWQDLAVAARDRASAEREEREYEQTTPLPSFPDAASAVTWVCEQLYALSKQAELSYPVLDHALLPLRAVLARTLSEVPTVAAALQEMRSSKDFCYMFSDLDLGQSAKCKALIARTLSLLEPEQGGAHTLDTSSSTTVSSIARQERVAYFRALTLAKLRELSLTLGACGQSMQPNREYHAARTLSHLQARVTADAVLLLEHTLDILHNHKPFLFSPRKVIGALQDLGSFLGTCRLKKDSSVLPARLLSLGARLDAALELERLPSQAILDTTLARASSDQLLAVPYRSGYSQALPLVWDAFSAVIEARSKQGPSPEAWNGLERCWSSAELQQLYTEQQGLLVCVFLRNQAQQWTPTSWILAFPANSNTPWATTRAQELGLVPESTGFTYLTVNALGAAAQAATLGYDLYRLGTEVASDFCLLEDTQDLLARVRIQSEQCGENLAISAHKRVGYVPVGKPEKRDPFLYGVLRRPMLAPWGRP